MPALKCYVVIDFAVQVYTSIFCAVKSATGAPEVHQTEVEVL